MVRRWRTARQVTGSTCITWITAAEVQQSRQGRPQGKGRTFSSEKHREVQTTQMLEASFNIKQSTFTTLILKQVEYTELAAMTFGF